MTDHLEKTPGLEVYRIDRGPEGGVLVALDFAPDKRPGPGPFLTLTVDQWTGLQHLARSITWPAT